MWKTFLFKAIQFNKKIQFSISMPLVLFTRREGPIRCCHAGPEWTWEQWQWRDTHYSPNPQHYWDLTIRLFSVISRTLIGEVLSLCRGAVSVFYSPSQLGNLNCRYVVSPGNIAVWCHLMFRILLRHAW